MARYLAYKWVWIDDITYDKLYQLFGIIKGFGYVSRNRIYDAILYEWIKSDGCTKIGDRHIILNQDDSKNHCLRILVDEEFWGIFSIMVRKRELSINNGFKIAAYYFLDLIGDDYDLLLYYFYE